MTEEQEKLLRNGRTMLWVAFVAAIISVPALFLRSPILFIACWFPAFIAGAVGIRDAARGFNGNPVLMYTSLVLVFMPVFNVAPLGYYLWRATGALAGDLEEAEVPAPAPRKVVAATRPASAVAAPGASTSGAGSPNAKARARLLTAIASVKAAGIDLQGADGTLLQVNIPGAPAGSEGSLPIVRGTQGTFAVCYLIDQGESYAYANADDLKASGLSLDALHMVAVKNLARQVNGKPGLQLLPQAEGWFGLAMGGQFEASLLLVDVLWDSTFREHCKTAPVATIPSRDVLGFCDEGNTAGIAALRAMAERIRTQGDGFICDKLLVRRDGRWHVFAGDVAPASGDLPPLEFPR